MNSILKSSALAVMLSLAMATTAKATQPDSNATSVKPADSQSLVAQMPMRSRFDATRTRPFVDEMIMIHMEMVNAAQRAMQSPDPEIRRMAEETIKSSNVAQASMRSRFDATRTRPFIDEMIMLHMEMVNAAQGAMQSPDPEIRKMAEATMRSSNAQINTLMEMRRKFFENPDKG